MVVNIILVHDMLDGFRKENLLRRASEHVHVEAVACSDPGELRLFLADYDGRIDGMLFTNVLLLESMKGSLPPVPCEAVYPSGGDLLHMTNARAGGAYRGSLSRVLVDIGEGGHIFDDILQTQFRPMLMTRETYRANTALPLMPELLSRYKSAWNSGAFDLVIMNHRDLSEPLRQAGINTWCLLPGVETLYSAAERMALSILAGREDSRCPIAVFLSDRSDKTPPAHLGEIVGSLGFVRNDFSMEVHRGMVTLYGFGIEREKLVSGRLVNSLYGHVTAAAGKEICIGLGIGVNMPHAVSMGQRAYRESLLDIDALPYIVTEGGELLGPFGGRSIPTATADNYEHLRGAANRAGISVMTLAKLLAARDKIGTDIVTSDELARCLGVTRRSASRLLSALAQRGAAALCEYQNDATRGRPAKRYRLMLEG